MQKNILVTGGVGYIGSHACVELLASGCQVIVIDNLSNSKREVLNQIEKITGKSLVFIHADIRDRQALDTIFCSHSVDAVMHFAGLKAVGESCEQPLRYYENNVYGTMVLIESMLAANVKNLIFSSSATVYAEANKLPYTEESLVSASNPYGRTKLMIEQMLTDLSLADLSSATNPWKIVLLRYFNPIGAHESGLIGENPNGIPNNLIPYVSQVAIGKLEQLSVFGNDYSTPDGTGIRDYIHVVDLVKGHIRALEMFNKPAMLNGDCKVYNLGTGTGYSVLEIITAFEKITKRKIDYKISPRRSGDIAISVADANLAKKELGWKAEKTLDDMIKDTWNWQTQNFNKSL
jgi:UDP-glucose 4-epimerase